MQIHNWLRQAEQQLHTAEVATARLDALVLLEDALDKDRAYLLAHDNDEIPTETLTLLERQIKRRSKHEPLAYIRGKMEFYGREFIVNNHVLEPRPESETMIDLAKALPLPDSPRIADVGSGSGALGITLALELGTNQADLYDIDPLTFEIAQQNAEKHSVTATCTQSNLVAKATQPYDVLLCNLPYVPDNFQINTAAGHEPRHAIFGGMDGLDLYRTMFAQIAERTDKPAFITCESLPIQHKSLAHLARAQGYVLYTSEDFIQVFEPMSPAGQSQASRSA